MSTEAELASLWGLPRGLLAAARAHLEMDTHWVRSGRHVVYTESGVEALRKALEEMGTPVTPTAKERPAPATPGTEEEPASVPVATVLTAAQKDAPPAPRRAHLRVTKVFPVNRRLIEAVEVVLLPLSTIPKTTWALALDAKPQHVRVRTNQHFRIGMVAPCVHLTGDLWALDRACPRFPGRW